MRPKDHQSARPRLRSAWRIGRWLLLVGVLGWFALPYVVQPEGRLPSQLSRSANSERIYDAPMHIRLAGEDYCVPRNYFFAPIDPGVDQRQVLLLALLPDLEPRNRANQDEMRRTRGWGRRIQMLITATDDPVASLTHRYQWRSETMGPFVGIGRSFGLVAMSTDDRARLGRWEMYVQPSNDPSAGFIQCVHPSDARSPSCEQIFTVPEDLVVTASYGRSFLSEWREIAVHIERLFEGFRGVNDRGGCQGASA